MLEKIREIIVKNNPEIDPESITEATDLALDLGWTSLDMMTCIVDAEESFGKTIPDEKLDKIHSVGDIIEMLK